MKTLDAKMATPIPTEKTNVVAAVVVPIDSPNNSDGSLIFLEVEDCKLNKEMD